jgi:hypothetical protein
MSGWSLLTLNAVWRGIQGSHTLRMRVTFTRGGKTHTGTVTGMGSMLGVNVDGELQEDVRPDQVTHAEVIGRHLETVRPTDV